MKKIVFYSVIVLSFLVLQACNTKKGPGKIVVKSETGQPGYFQKQDGKAEKIMSTPEGMVVYAGKEGETGYFIYIDRKMKYNYIYLSPGAEIVVTEDTNGVRFSGDNSEINEYINTHRYIGSSKGEEVAMFSDEWIAAREKEMADLNAGLDNSGLPEEFIRNHKLYNQFMMWSQRLNSPADLAMFQGVSFVLAPDYYDFLKDVDFEDERILNQPKWFPILLKAMEEMEKAGMIEISLDNYFDVYAKRISNEKVRSWFMYELLNRVLELGYSDDFPAYLEIARKDITDPEVLSLLPETEKRYGEQKEKNALVVRGQKAPDFEAVDVDGKVYKSSDFAGKVMILDFWFTGCAPCKAEMPYFAEMAEEMAGEDVVFISMSLDTEGELLDMWKKLVADKQGAVYYLNVPGGFKAEYPAKYLIRSVPRIVIVDKEGNIVDAYAKRPSDPKLKLQLERLSKK